MTIEKLRKRQVEVETILWDGTHDRADQITRWVGCQQVDVRTVLDPGPVLVDGHANFAVGRDPSGPARLWVAHNGDWCTLPVGYRVAKELDGSGFYPLSPDGAAAGYHLDDGPWRLEVPVVPEHVTAFTDGEEKLWVRRTDDPQLWTPWLGHGADSLRLRVGAVIVMNALPLVEHPDPRKATT